MADGPIPFHHGSHEQLLWASADPAPAGPSIDAIIVPTARPLVYLAEVAALAQALNCPLVTLHSGKWTTAADAARRFPPEIDLIAIDVPGSGLLRLPHWETSRLLAGTVFARRTDLSAKRNLALMLSQMLGWSRVLFFDDDITGLNPAHMRAAGSLLSTHSAVGLRIGGFSDNSVVCHAYRQSGGEQSSFVGGGALAINVGACLSCSSFFPDIYNDDWFFLLDGDKWLQPTAMTGHVIQKRYDPFRTPDRARSEELGDVLAEGIYWLLDQDRSIYDADREHWARFLVRRRLFIESVLKMVETDDLKEDERARRIAALKGSLGRLALISPQLCEDYLRAWARDRHSWRQHLDLLPAHRERSQALDALPAPGSPGLTWHLTRQPGRGLGIAGGISGGISSIADRPDANYTQASILPGRRKDHPCAALP
jgi:hypothetical protein